jgi:DNA-binding FrmR family transcriptional regulator
MSVILADRVNACVREAIHAGTTDEMVPELDSAARRYVRGR